MINKIGSDYGGWMLDIDLVPKNSTVISCGIGNDFSFDLELIKRKHCNIVAVDPSSLTIKSLTKAKIIGSNFVYIKSALHSHDGSVFMSDVGSNGDSMFNVNKKKEVSSISLETLLQRFPGPSVIKINVEGGEYLALNTIDNFDNAIQICIRFHHRKNNVPFDFNDTKKCIEKIINSGYSIAYENDPTLEKVDYEVLFIKDNN